MKLHSNALGSSWYATVMFILIQCVYYCYNEVGNFSSLLKLIASLYHQINNIACSLLHDFKWNFCQITNKLTTFNSLNSPSSISWEYPSIIKSPCMKTINFWWKFPNKIRTIPWIFTNLYKRFGNVEGWFQLDLWARYTSIKCSIGFSLSLPK